MKDAVRSLWRDLSDLRAKRPRSTWQCSKSSSGMSSNGLGLMSGPGRLMRHFADLRPIDRLGEAADFPLSHGAVPLAAEQVLADIGTLEAESGGGRTRAH